MTSRPAQSHSSFGLRSSCGAGKGHKAKVTDKPTTKRELNYWKMEVSTTSKKSTIFEECANCAASANSVTLKSCAKCMLVKYCGRACQLQHWKSGGHKLFCIASVSRVLHVPSQMKSQLCSTGTHMRSYTGLRLEFS